MIALLYLLSIPAAAASIMWAVNRRWPQKPPAEPELVFLPKWPPIEHITIQLARCTGHCCESFPIGGTDWHPHQLQRYLRHSDKVNGRPEEGPYIAAMLVPLTGQRTPRDGRIVKGMQLYACRHFDQQTRNCTDYDNRPKLCSEYPYNAGTALKDGRCNQPLCTRRTATVVVARLLG